MPSVVTTVFFLVLLATSGFALSTGIGGCWLSGLHLIGGARSPSSIPRGDGSIIRKNRCG